MAVEVATHNRPFREPRLREPLLPADLAPVQIIADVHAHDQRDLAVPVAHKVFNGAPGAFLQFHADRVEAGHLAAVVQQHGRDLRMLKLCQVGFEQHAGEEDAVHAAAREVPDLAAFVGR
ncbi:hypothetical protein SRABI26_02553 [Arthrobacter sp. Bi26]|nr:hypothetical protein SRABI26_02553 [Arthrobacter sp. Bi26]